MELPPGLVPRPDMTAKPWWEALAQGRLMVQRCSGCDRAQLYPRAHCTACWATELALESAGGRGTLLSVTVTHRHPEPAFAPPFAYAIVELDEGPRLTSIVRAANDRELAVGMAVRVVFEPAGHGLQLPLFEFV